MFDLNGKTCDPNSAGGSFWIVTTRLCNLSCVYCFQGADHSWQDWKTKAGLKPMIDDKVMRATVEFLKGYARNVITPEQRAKQGPQRAGEYQSRDETAIVWYGGEPLVAWKMIKRWTPIINKVMKENNKAVRQSITTNGLLLDQEKRDFMDEHKMGLLWSVDGPPWLHNQTRLLAGGKPSWNKIPFHDIAAWKYPEIEIAWQLDPSVNFQPSDIDWMLNQGFHRINFNINWLSEWDFEARERLRVFMRYALRLAIQSDKKFAIDTDAYQNDKTLSAAYGVKPTLTPPVNQFSTNWMGKLNRLFSAGQRDSKPCGTGIGMLAVTPEGWLYPSQEMATLVFEPNRAEGTAEYYRLGDVLNQPVIDWERVKANGELSTSDMVPPAPFDCDDCAANKISFGGCHCRYVGQTRDGKPAIDPSYRYEVMPGYCQVMQTVVGAMFEAAHIEGWLQLKGSERSSQGIGRNSNGSDPVTLLQLKNELKGMVQGGQGRFKV